MKAHHTAHFISRISLGQFGRVLQRRIYIGSILEPDTFKLLASQQAWHIFCERKTDPKEFHIFLPAGYHQWEWSDKEPVAFGHHRVLKVSFRCCWLGPHALKMCFCVGSWINVIWKYVLYIASWPTVFWKCIYGVVGLINVFHSKLVRSVCFGVTISSSQTYMHHHHHHHHHNAKTWYQKFWTILQGQKWAKITRKWKSIKDWNYNESLKNNNYWQDNLAMWQPRWFIACKMSDQIESSSSLSLSARKQYAIL